MFAGVLGKARQWLLQEPEEPRRAPRSSDPAVVVYYWDGSAPEGRRIRDISTSGAYIYTTERWYVGTIIRIILQGYHPTAREGEAAAKTASTCIPSRVVRHGPDGVAVEFVFQNKEEKEDLARFLAEIPAQPVRVAATAPVGREGQALVEFSLIIPLVFLLAVNAVNFGGFIFAWITVAGAARAGVQYMSLSAASPGSATPASLAQITAVVTNDVSSLLNRNSLVVAICSNGTTTANGCTSLIDPEAPAFSLAAVDVTYTYKPFIPLFSFPKLGIGATLPSSIVHRKAVMRVLQ